MLFFKDGALNQGAKAVQKELYSGETTLVVAYGDRFLFMNRQLRAQLPSDRRVRAASVLAPKPGQKFCTLGSHQRGAGIVLVIETGVESAVPEASKWGQFCCAVIGSDRDVIKDVDWKSGSALTELHPGRSVIVFTRDGAVHRIENDNGTATPTQFDPATAVAARVAYLSEKMRAIGREHIPPEVGIREIAELVSKHHSDPDVRAVGVPFLRERYGSASIAVRYLLEKLGITKSGQATAAPPRAVAGKR